MQPLGSSHGAGGNGASRDRQPAACGQPRDIHPRQWRRFLCVGRARRIVRPLRSSPRRGKRVVTGSSAGRSPLAGGTRQAQRQRSSPSGRTGSPGRSRRWLERVLRATSVNRSAMSGCGRRGLRSPPTARPPGARAGRQRVSARQRPSLAERLRAVTCAGSRARAHSRFGLPTRVDSTNGGFARLVTRFSSGGRGSGWRGKEVEG